MEINMEILKFIVESQMILPDAVNLLADHNSYRHNGWVTKWA